MGFEFFIYFLEYFFGICSLLFRTFWVEIVGVAFVASVASTLRDGENL